MAKALIFDLDNCLAPAQEVGEELYQPAFDAIRHANQATISEAALEEAFSEIWRHPLDWVADRYGFSEQMLAAAWRVFASLQVRHPMHGYGDLDTLAQLPGLRFLVTSGFQCLQQSKIKSLGLAPHFANIYIDAIDAPDRIGKQGLFAQILREYSLTPAEVLVIGDNADSEIEAGNRLGIRTVQTLRPGVPKAANATLYVQDLGELKALLR